MTELIDDHVNAILLEAEGRLAKKSAVKSTGGHSREVTTFTNSAPAKPNEQLTVRQPLGAKVANKVSF